MLRRLTLGALMIVLGIGLTLGAGYAVGHTTDTPAPPGDTAAILAKLDQVLANQERIVQRLDAMDEQLRIIKVRASQKH